VNDGASLTLTIDIVTVVVAVSLPSVASTLNTKLVLANVSKSMSKAVVISPSGIY
jgi:hypothetical protein